MFFEQPGCRVILSMKWYVGKQFCSSELDTSLVSVMCIKGVALELNCSVSFSVVVGKMCRSNEYK